MFAYFRNAQECILPDTLLHGKGKYRLFLTKRMTAPMHASFTSELFVPGKQKHTKRARDAGPLVFYGSPGRIRTYNLSVNSRVLCR